ncbi:uroporphyrinogen decarboxylase family protein [Kiritimatiella glycovorans]|uniref:Uroporphyrinogen decarboxylase (URO-D) domain-containing protein n=1 Tax=Kiritimatiella glycovorans TaxID=1307763 RepID=A0A0G3EAX6_9BACT|nr:uroporphyrinogen decarboxylase family protein [Kiritimatiella glycovorans]AKJ63423.1 hypothetical protein L21SP4_00138 [Kiritimatiella glycovorans]
MTSKERTLRAIHFEEPDRVPVNYMCNPGINERLKRHFGLAPEDNYGLLAALGVDLYTFCPMYTGAPLFDPVPDRQINEWGMHTRWVEHGSGGYWDYCDFPLREAEAERLAEWPMPDPDDFNYDEGAALCAQYPDKFWMVGSPGVGDFINSSGMLMGTEDVLIRMAEGDEAFMDFWDRRLEVQLGMLERAIDRCDGHLDMIWMGEDLGTQLGPMISLDMYRDLLRPRHHKIIDLGHAHGLPVMIHSCGSSSWAFEDFVDMGIRVVDTLQPEAANMDPAYLKQNFGSRLAFHGCISTAGPVASGTVEDTVADCRAKLEVLMPGGGYCFAPTHALQDNSPTENVVAMYEAVRTHGRY